jgi:serine/threonine-protein kinase
MSSPARLAAALSDRYRLERELGAGGMATVYLAQDLKHERQVAIKVLRPELAAVLGVERFLNEVRITAGLDHPHILHLIDSGESDGFLWYVLPYIRGETLRARLGRDTQLPLEAALAITRQLAGALDYAHRQGVIHRDLKPENVLLFEGEAMLADFGIALAIRAAGGDRLTETGLSLGTPQYMSPEQASGERQIDARSDIYSLGAVVYEMLAGEPPLTGATAQAVIAKLMTTDPVSLGVLRPALPAAIQQAVSRALAKVPADRWASAGEFAAALEGGQAGPKGLPDGRGRTGGRSDAVTVSVPSRAATSRRRTAVWVGVAIVVAALGFAGLRWRPDASGPRSVAVLPLDNVGNDPENEAYSDGMADELTSRLGKVEGLEVAPRTSAFSFKGRGLTATEIGHQLQVQYVLAGSLRRAGDRMRVSAELINVGTGRRLWSEEYEKAARDMFAMEDEITGAIVGALKARLSVTDSVSLSRRRTDSPEAHDLYLRGRYFFDNRADTVSLRKAQEFFEGAIRADSGYALAWAGLSDAWSHSGVFGRASVRAVYAPAKAAVLRALALDSSLVEAHASQAFISLFFDWDRPAADRELRIALALDPRYSPAHLFRAWYYVVVDSMVQAVNEGRLAVELEPFSRINNARLADFLNLDGQYQAALAQARRLLELDPNYVQGHSAVAKMELDLGHCDEALAEVAKAPDQTTATFTGLRGHIFARCGKPKEARAEIERIAANSRRGGFGPHYDRALIYTDLGETNQAFAQLDSAVIDRDWPMITLLVRKEFQSLHADPRYQRILERVGLVSAAARHE